MFSLILSATFVVVSICFILVLFRRWRHSHKKFPRRTVRLGVVLGSGGHTGEMLRLVSSFNERYAERFYVIAETDSTSAPRLTEMESKKKSGVFQVFTIPRSREVRQSYVSSIYTTLISLFRSASVVFSMKPDVLLVNGPGTCVPICLWVYLFDLLGLITCEIVYVESICRVHRLSLTGKLLYYLRLAVVIVQWQPMLKMYPRALYLGRF